MLLAPALAARQPILLVGNSFTGLSYEQIPQKSQFVARWVGGWNLDQHAFDPISQARICETDEFVLLQDFSQQAQDPAAFHKDIEDIAQVVRNCQVQPVLFMTWETDFIDYATVRDAYLLAAQQFNMQLVQVGTVWRRVRLNSESFYQSLLEADGKHPTFRGRKVTAASILRAFCQSCYESYDWSGFSTAERDFLRTTISEVILPIVKTEPIAPTPQPEPIPEPLPIVTPILVELLLDRD